MVHLYTSKEFIPDGVKVHEGIESTFFNKILRPDKIYFDDNISNELLRSIEGVTKRNGNTITTKFGTVTIKELSTGCKAALIAANFPSICIVSAYVGDNVLIALLKSGEKRDIHILMEDELGYRVLKEGRNITVTVNNQTCSLSEAYEIICDILDSDD